MFNSQQYFQQYFQLALVPYFGIIGPRNNYWNVNLRFCVTGFLKRTPLSSTQLYMTLILPFPRQNKQFK